MLGQAHAGALEREQLRRRQGPFGCWTRCDRCGADQSRPDSLVERDRGPISWDASHFVPLCLIPI